MPAGKIRGVLDAIEAATDVGRDPRVTVDHPTIGRLELMREEAGTTILLTTHQMEEAERQCDRLAIMNLGSIAATGSPEELREQFEADSLEDVFTAATGGTLEEGGSFRDVRATRKRSRRLA